MATNRKLRAAFLSIGSNSLLIAMKLFVGLTSGSISILSEAAHSGADLLAALNAAISLIISAKPADKSHPYGHGKFENVSGVIEGLLIFAAAAFIIVESAEKIAHPGDFRVTHAAIIVMAASAVINFFVSRHLYKVAKEEDSIALEADALHLKTDVYTSAGVALGLLTMRFTGIHLLDPIVAIAVAMLILREAWHLCCSAFSPLLDSSLPEDEETAILNLLEEHVTGDFRFCHLRTRKSGPNRFVDFHAQIKPSMPVKKANEITRHLQEEIEKLVPNVHVHVNVEPMDD